MCKCPITLFLFVCLCVQELSNHVGLNVAQASSESIGAREIHELIEKDVPQVIHMYIVIYTISINLAKSSLLARPPQFFYVVCVRGPAGEDSTRVHRPKQ